MVKKPPLSIVSTSTTGSSPPRTLGKPGLSLWRAITAEYDVTDSGGIETLMQVCEAADRVQEVAAQIDRDGLMIRTKTGTREHPLLRTEFGLRSYITRNLQRLGVNVEAVQNVGRPPQAKGLTWRDVRDD